MLRAKEKLSVVIPMTLLIIFLLLYLNFKSVAKSLIVLLTVPFALMGGVWFLWLLGYNLSVAVWIGMIALAGVAAEIGVVMVTFLDEAVRKGKEADSPGNTDGLKEAIIRGAVRRVRPVVMTASAIFLGLLPIMWSAGTGADVMKRIAAPMVGGILTTTLLTLLVIPAIYSLWQEWEQGRKDRNGTLQRIKE